MAGHTSSHPTPPAPSLVCLLSSPAPSLHCSEFSLPLLRHNCRKSLASDGCSTLRCRPEAARAQLGHAKGPCKEQEEA